MGILGKDCRGALAHVDLDVDSDDRDACKLDRDDERGMSGTNGDPTRSRVLCPVVARGRAPEPEGVLYPGFGVLARGAAFDEMLVDR